MTDSIKIGKNVLENLTIGMYEDAKFIYREYIQNATDSMDHALHGGLYKNKDGKIPSIDIEIDEVKRNIRITDYGYGIKHAEVHSKLANIADSTKEKGVDRGFRGIGRLGGLAYCRSLKFRTTYPGEDVETTMIWNAQKLIQMLNDPLVTADAEQTIQEVISYTSNPCSSDDHYFIVELDDILEESKELLNIDHVSRYISENAPVDYNVVFHFRYKINQYLAENDLSLLHYPITINGEPIRKNYSPNLFESAGTNTQRRCYDKIEDLRFEKFRNKKGELLGWLWFGVCCYRKQLQVCNQMRGLRLRKDNIQIGNERTLVRFFKESRGNLYFIGEVHAVHKDLIPNARRDYFIENTTRVELEAALQNYFYYTLTPLYRNANNMSNALKKEHESNEKIAEYMKKLPTANQNEKGILESEIDRLQAQSEKYKKICGKYIEKSKSDEIFSKVAENISKITPEIKKHKEQLQKTNNLTGNFIGSSGTIHNITDITDFTNSLEKLTPSERDLIGRVYKVIHQIMPPDQAIYLIEKIQNQLK